MEKIKVNRDFSPEEKNMACFKELTPREFNRHKEMVVVLVRAEHARNEFDAFRDLIVISETRELDAYLDRLEAGQPIGLVCPNGECSGRMALRLSNKGFPVFHLGGGLQEWYHSFRGGDHATGCPGFDRVSASGK